MFCIVTYLIVFASSVIIIIYISVTTSATSQHANLVQAKEFEKLCMTFLCLQWHVIMINQAFYF